MSAGLDAIREARATGRTAVPEPAAKALARAHGIAVPRGAQVRDWAELSAAAATLTYPLVLKVVSAAVVHKSDVGGVVTGIGDADTLEAAWRRITAEPRLKGVVVDGWLVEESAPPGVELVIGARLDPTFGPSLMIGAGGIFLELLDDVAFRICPVADDDVRDMLSELRTYPRLRGARGTVAVDLDAVVDAGRRVAELLTALADDVQELEINPLITGPDFAVAADVRIILRQDQDRS